MTLEIFADDLGMLPPQVTIEHEDGQTACDVVLEGEREGKPRLTVHLRAGSHIESYPDVVRDPHAIQGAISRLGERMRDWINEETRRKKMLRGF